MNDTVVRASWVGTAALTITSVGAAISPAFKVPAFVVYCDKSLDEEELATVARTIEQIKPVNVGYKLRVKAPQKKTGTRETK